MAPITMMGIKISGYLQDQRHQRSMDQYKGTQMTRIIMISADKICAISTISVQWIKKMEWK